MTIKCRDRIPREKFNTFHAILCSTYGYYLDTPYDTGHFVVVSYGYDDMQGYADHCEAWKRVNTPIREIRRNQMFRRWLRKLGLLR